MQRPKKDTKQAGEHRTCTIESRISNSQRPIGRFNGYSAVSRIARKRLGQNSTLTPVLATLLPAIQGTPKRLKKARECNVQRKTLSRPANPWKIACCRRLFSSPSNAFLPD